MNMYHEQSKNTLKTWLLMAMFLAIIVALGWAFSEVYNNPFILTGAIIFSIVMNIVSYWYSDKIVLSMHGAIPVTMQNNAGLYRIVENLAITAGLPMPKVYYIPDSSLNAFATGRNKAHAAVVVTQGLLDRLNKPELEGVIAHELAHIGNKDILLMTVVVVLVGFVSLLSQLFIRTGPRFGGREPQDRRHKLAIVGLVLAILSPIAAALIQLAISRKREYLADASGALLTRYPEGLASALEKISGSAPLRNANAATAHMFISNPFGPTGKVANLFSTHPPAQQRIAILRGMKV
jgi:heat shock protein HtpX